MKPATFLKELEKNDILLTERQSEQFTKYYQILIEWNEKINLTGLTEKSEVYLKHFYDSLSLAFFLDMKDYQSLCDVGAGAGFPSIPLKICYPHLNVTIIDSLQKRIRFLQHLTSELALEGINLVHARAEDAGQQKKFRENFDLVTARAVARMSVLSELCIPFVKLNGKFVAMKGVQIEDELNKGKKAIHTLGGKVKDIHTFQLPIEKSERSIIVIEKDRRTAKRFPRKAGTPNRHPIK